jgi:alpha-galactosidase
MKQLELTLWAVYLLGMSVTIGCGQDNENQGDVPGGSADTGMDADADMDTDTDTDSDTDTDTDSDTDADTDTDTDADTDTDTDADTDTDTDADTDTGTEPEMLAATPPMGWNSWNTFGCNINEQLIKEVADAMVSSGMQAVGYEYVNIDDCWMDGRDADGNLRWNAETFPSGIEALAEYVHGLGLKLGIYEAANFGTCTGVYGGNASVYVGSLGYEQQDAETFASWGIDYLKYDLCAGSRDSIRTMGTAINNVGRPILYSINPGNGEGDLDPPKDGWDMLGVAHIWRIGFDISNNWDAVIRLIDQNSELYPWAGPGGFNDPDMLEVGKLADANEDRAHFSLWAIMAAPLIAGNDIRSMSDTTRDILTNFEVIAVNQDPLGIQGRIVATPGPDLQVWSKELSGTNKRAVVLFNRSSDAASITVNWSDIDLPAGEATVRDLWRHMDFGLFTDSYAAEEIPSHGVAIFKIESIP